MPGFIIANCVMIKNCCKFSCFLFFCFISLTFIGCKSKKAIVSASSKTRSNAGKGNIKERYAAVLKVSEQHIKNEKLYAFIDDWMGVPHRLGGMSKSGVDCSGFTTLLEREIYNKTVPRTARQMAEQVKVKSEKELEEGDLVFFDFEGKKFSHVGVYLQNNRFVHASGSKGVTISNLKDVWYHKVFSRAGYIR